MRMLGIAGCTAAQHTGFSGLEGHGMTGTVHPSYWGPVSYELSMKGDWTTV